MTQYNLRQNKTPFTRMLFKTGFAAVFLLLAACSGVATTSEQQQSIFAADHESADLADVTQDALRLSQQAGKQNILVVFDIDNTLLAMEQGLGSDQWYDWQKELGNNDRCNPANVGDRFAAQGALYLIKAGCRVMKTVCF